MYANKFAKYVVLCLLAAYIPSALAVSGLPWHSTFDAGNTSEWNGWHSGTVEISNEQSYGSGGYAAKVNVVGGTVNNHYLEHYFGDHAHTGLDKVEEVYLRFFSMFENSYAWPRSHKLAIFNITDGTSSQRRYQVYIHIGADGRYYVEHSYIDTWRFFGLNQNVGTPPATVELNRWDKVKLYVKLNTPGSSDGIIRLWVNDELKMEHSALNLRQNTSFGINKAILSSYTTFTNGGNTTQWHDNWYISETDPDTTAPSAPVLQVTQ